MYFNPFLGLLLCIHHKHTHTVQNVKRYILFQSTNDVTQIECIVHLPADVIICFCNNNIINKLKLNRSFHFEDFDYINYGSTVGACNKDNMIRVMTHSGTDGS